MTDNQDPINVFYTNDNEVCKEFKAIRKMDTRIAEIEAKMEKHAEKFKKVMDDLQQEIEDQEKLISEKEDEFIKKHNINLLRISDDPDDPMNKDKIEDVKFKKNI